jgi:hypothetical protein
MGAEVLGNLAEAGVLVESEDFVDGGVVFPERGEFEVGEESDVGLGVGFAEAEEGRGGHDGIAEPIDAADEDSQVG